MLASVLTAEEVSLPLFNQTTGEHELRVHLFTVVSLCSGGKVTASMCRCQKCGTARQCPSP